MKGMALILSLLLVLLLTLFCFGMVLLAGSYYGSTRNLIELENARLICDSVSNDFIAEHNQDTDPRLFFDTAQWIQFDLLPRIKYGYEIRASLQQPWNVSRENLLTVTARKGPFESRHSLRVRQFRLEDFALYSSCIQVLNQASLFDGLVLAPAMELQKPLVRFRDRVYGKVNPPEMASFRKWAPEQLHFPALSDFLSMEVLREDASLNGMIISKSDPVLWTGTYFYLQLDDLLLENSGDTWKVHYSDHLLGEIRSPHLFFEGPVHITQSFSMPEFPPYPVPEVPMVISSSGSIQLESGLHSLRGLDAVHPLSLVTGGSVRTAANLPSITVMDAMMIALGTEEWGGTDVSLIVDPNSIAATDGEKSAFYEEVSHSAFILEEEKKMKLLQALESGQRVLWFKQTVAVSGGMIIPGEIAEVHFSESRSLFSTLPSFPYVQILEGSKQWQ